MASVKSYNHPKGSASRTGSHAEGYTKATKAFIQGLKRGVKASNRKDLRMMAQGRIDFNDTCFKVFIAQP